MITFIIALTAWLIMAAPGPGDGPDTATEVRRALAAGDTASAIHRLEHTDLEKIRDPELFILLGRLHRSRSTIVDRLKSAYVLERAVQLFPDDPNVIQEMGLTYYSQTFYPDAARCFRKAIDIDPSLCDAKYKLGVTYYERWKLRVNAYFDDAARARMWLKVAVECDSTNFDAARRYVSVLYALERTDEAVDAARVFAALFPGEPVFPLIVGTVAYDETRMAEADSAYNAALWIMSNEEHVAYTTLNRNILGYKDFDVYDVAETGDQDVMDRAYWITGDPDPTTDLNPIHLEHVYRTFRADLYFSYSKVHLEWTTPQFRGWDTERGEVSIKFGWPDDILASHGGWRWEEWLYRPPGGIIRFMFNDEYLTGNYQIPSSSSGQLVYTRHQSRVTHVKRDKVEINGAIDAVVFRDDDLLSSLYVMAEVNADSVMRVVDAASLESFHIRTRLFDSEWNTQLSSTDTVPAFNVPRVQGTLFDLFDVAKQFRMPFDYYNIAFAFQDGAGEVISVLRCHSDGNHLITDDVITSDLLFLRDSADGATIVRGGKILHPNPWRIYGHGQRLRVYFEVYNLNVTGGRSEYRVTYEISGDPETPRRAWNRLGRAVAGLFGVGGDPVAAQSFVRVGTSHSDQEQIAIDVDALKNGRHRLSVSIHDLRSGDKTVMRKNFFKVGAPETGNGATASSD